VVARLAELDGPVDAAKLRAIAEQVAGASLERFFARYAPSAVKAQPAPGGAPPQPSGRSPAAP
jgi:hypothetical protein